MWQLVVSRPVCRRVLGSQRPCCPNLGSVTVMLLQAGPGLPERGGLQAAAASCFRLTIRLHKQRDVRGSWCPGFALRRAAAIFRKWEDEGRKNPLEPTAAV